MKRTLLVFVSTLLICLTSMLVAAKATTVKSYTTKKGTYVQSYKKTSPDKTVRNNYSYKGNYNPYTGKIGTNKYKNNPTSEYY